MKRLYINSKLNPVTFDVMFVDDEANQIQKLDTQSALNLQTLVDFLTGVIIKNNIEQVNVVGMELAYELIKSLAYQNKHNQVKLHHLKQWNLKG